LIFFLKFSRQRFQRVAEVEIVANKLDLKEWVVEAIKAHGGVAHAIDSAKFIWVNYHDELQRCRGSLLHVATRGAMGHRRSPKGRQGATELKGAERSAEAEAP
jgi:hypothetical protein